MFDDNVIRLVPDLTEDRLVGMIIVVTQSQLPTILFALHRTPINSPVVRIQVDSVNRIAVILLAYAEIVELHVFLNEIAQAHCHFGRNEESAFVVRFHLRVLVKAWHKSISPPRLSFLFSESILQTIQPDGRTGRSIERPHHSSDTV